MIFFAVRIGDRAPNSAQTRPGVSSLQKLLLRACQKKADGQFPSFFPLDRSAARLGRLLRLGGTESQAVRGVKDRRNCPA